MSDHTTACTCIDPVETRPIYCAVQGPGSASILPNNDEVICPECVHQFRAIPINVQKELVALRAALAERQAVQQWEYKTWWVPRHISSMDERLNAYGADGWEFCGIDHDGMHVFKRALATKDKEHPKGTPT